MSTTYRLRSERLREAAEAKGDTTSYAVAKRTGLAESTLSRMHTGKSKPSMESLLILARTYEVAVDELIDASVTEAVPA
jgi:transcriptional regulator with XRE-family HTH domain